MISTIFLFKGQNIDIFFIIESFKINILDILKIFRHTKNKSYLPFIYC